MRQSWIVALGVLAGAIAPCFPLSLHAQKGKPQTDAERLQGTWQMVAVERVLLVPEAFGPMGQPTKYKAVRRVRGENRCQDEKWTFAGAEVRKHSFLGSEGDPYRLDAKKDPKEIDFTDTFLNEQTKKRETGSTQLGIYRLEKGALTVCVNDEHRGNQPDDPRRPARPTAFEAKADEKQSFTLYRLKRPTAAPRRTSTPPEGDAAVIAKNPRLLALAKERRAAALQEVEGRFKNIAQGKATPDRFLLEACQQLNRASLDLAKSREEQEALLEEHWARLYAIEDIQEQKYLLGREDITTYAPTRYARLDAELRLEMFRMKRPPKK